MEHSIIEPHEGRNGSGSVTYTLPDLAWAGLLWGIAKDAPTGSRVIVHTPAMLELTRARLQAYGRPDLMVELAVLAVSRDTRAA